MRTRTIHRILLALGGLSIVLGVVVLVGAALQGRELFSFDLGGGWGGVLAGLSTLALARQHSGTRRQDG